MTRSIRISAGPGEHRIALLDAGRVVEFQVHRPHAPDGIGDLVLVRILARVPALAGAFCALPGGATGFLPDSEAKHLDTASRGEGLALPVRVTRAAQGGKGPRLTARLAEGEKASLPTILPAAPCLLRAAPHPALTLARRHQAPIATDSLALAATLGAEALREPAFDDALEAEFETACGAEVALPGGGRITIHPTPALVAIDIDSGAAGPDVNAAALAEVARQIRLRDLAGAILVDVAGLPVRRRSALAPGFAAMLDPMARFVGVTGLGLLEVQRPRIRAPLHEVMAGPLPIGLAGLRAAAREARFRPGQRLAIRASPRVLGALREAPAALQAYAAEAGAPLALIADPAVARYEVEEFRA